MLVIYCSKVEPSRKPRRGISAWKPPNHIPAELICFGLILPTERPLQIETAKASMERLTPIKKSSIIDKIDPSNIKKTKTYPQNADKSHHLKQCQDKIQSVDIAAHMRRLLPYSSGNYIRFSQKSQRVLKFLFLFQNHIYSHKPHNRTAEFFCQYGNIRKTTY